MSSNRPLIQIILRRDLLDLHSWTFGMLAAQTAHAATAVIQETQSDPLTQEYVSPDNLDKMRKTVLQTPDGESLVRLYQDILPLGKAKLWIEQPENIPTAIAIAPNKSKKIKDLLRHNGCVFF